MRIRTIAELVAGCPAFAGLTDRQLATVAGCGRNVHFDTGERILRVGDEADRFFIVRRGRVEITLSSPPEGTLTVATVGPGELLGVSWLAAPHRVVFDARASEPTDAVAFDAVCLRDKCDADHELGYALFGNFATLMRDRLVAARLQLLDLCGGRRG